MGVFAEVLGVRDGPTCPHHHIRPNGISAIIKTWLRIVQSAVLVPIPEMPTPIGRTPKRRLSLCARCEHMAANEIDRRLGHTAQQAEFLFGPLRLVMLARRRHRRQIAAEEQFVVDLVE
jgi:hypothetical protein